MGSDSNKDLTVAGEVFHMRVLYSADVFALVPLEEDIFPHEAWSESLRLEELTPHERINQGVFTPDPEVVCNGGGRGGQSRPPHPPPGRPGGALAEYKQKIS